MTALPGLSAGTWTVDPAHSEVGFTVRHLMVSKVKGRFADVSGTIVVANDILSSTVEATAQIASVDTRDANRDGHLKSPDFFDADTWPTMTFRSTGIQPHGDVFTLNGDLTIRDRTHPVSFSLEFNGAAANPMAEGQPVAGFSATGEISRKDFGLEWNVPLDSGGVLVGDKVTITLEIEAGKAA
ncbi:MAG: YceI family protein [Actinomycetota bacterium]